MVAFVMLFCNPELLVVGVVVGIMRGVVVGVLMVPSPRIE